jgi:primosomal protein N' (replication factor Y)
MFKYPPFYRMITITLKHRDARQLDRAAAQLAHELRKTFGNRILGPEYPVISRLQQWYQKIIWLKVEKKYSPSAVKKNISEKIDWLKNNQGNSTLIVMADVDPQ